MDVRTAMTRNGGSMADPGSVSYLFSRKGVVIVPKASGATEDDVLMAVLDAGAEEVNDLGDTFEVVCEPGRHGRRPHRAAGRRHRLRLGRRGFVPSVQVELDEDGAGKVFRLIDALEDLDDVQNVFANYDVSDEVMEKIDAWRTALPRRVAGSARAPQRADGARVRVGRPPVPVSLLEHVFERTGRVGMRVLGVDPGLTRCGWGVVDGRPGARPTAMAGRRRPHLRRTLDLELRLLERAHGVTALLVSTGPTRSPSSGSSASTTRARRWARRRPAGVARWPPRRPACPVACTPPARSRPRSPATAGPTRTRSTMMVTRLLGLADRRPSRPTPPTRWRWRSATSGAAPAQDRLRVAALAGGIGAPMPDRARSALDGDRR